MLKGNSTAEKIWNYLINAGLSPHGAAGLMGNLRAESGLRPNNLEDLCEKRLKEAGKAYCTDETYTTAIDSGQISRSEFLNPLPGKQYGYGLAQWTSPERKAGLYDLAKRRGVSIADLETQLDWLLSELKTSYKKVLEVLKTAKTVREASDYVLIHFEQPAYCGESVQVARAKMGQTIYDDYAKATTSDSINKLIGIMEEELGYLEKKTNDKLDSKTANAGSNNYTKYWRDVYPAYQGMAWCAAFVSWCFMKAFGLDTAKKLLKHWPYVYCPTLGDLFTKHSDPEVGDIVIFYRNGAFLHTGVVVDVAGDRFWTIEGNASGASDITPNGGGVVKKSYYNSQLPGTKFCRPDYSIVKGTYTASNNAVKTAGGGGYMFEVGTVQNGSKGNDVKLAQIMLNATGAKLSVDGDCGSLTVAAIKKYQNDSGLSVDGVCGPKTWAKLLMR